MASFNFFYSGGGTGPSAAWLQHSGLFVDHRAVAAAAQLRQDVSEQLEAPDAHFSDFTVRPTKIKRFIGKINVRTKQYICFMSTQTNPPAAVCEQHEGEEPGCCGWIWFFHMLLSETSEVFYPDTREPRKDPFLSFNKQ